MATTKLSPNMVKVLLAADTDGWIRKSDAPVNTSVALIERKLISVLHVVSRGDGSGYARQGHYLTDAGKAKVAELRGESPTADTRIVDPVEAYGLAVAEYVVRDGNPDDVMPAAPEIRAGDLIEIRQPGKPKWAMRVERYNGFKGWQGTQIRMTDGREGRTRFTGELKPGEYTIVERLASGAARPVVRAAETRPARVTATVADDDNVPVLSKAQIDGLHWIGATGVSYFKSEKPTRPTINALRRFKLVADYSLDLTDAGRAAYLANKPTGRLSKPFGDAWRAAQAGVAFDNIAGDVQAALDELPAAKPELPTIDELLQQIRLYRSTGDPMGPKYHAIRETLEALYREAGR